MVSDSRRRRSGWKSQREQGEKEREGEKRVKERGRGRVCDRDASQPLMVRTFLKVYMELCSYFLFLQEQIKDIIIIW
jgi:hypothetical protein